ncbi:MAG: hypothetical protein KDI50_08115 [Candidatus Competibacteraceae bacterium]|nr:hypothetical protein [Candidatus Competibacteraceae bacterium]
MNTPAERQKVRLAMLMIERKYKPWIQNHSNYRFLYTMNDQEFDSCIVFLDPAPFSQRLFLETGASHITGCVVAGFVSRRLTPHKMYINRTQASSSTVIHELLHFLTHDNFHQSVSGIMNEGVTEYFTRKTLSRAVTEDDDDFKTGRAAYEQELQRIRGMRCVIKTVYNPMTAPDRNVTIGGARSADPKYAARTQDFMKRAYFRGEQAMIDLLNETF